MMTRLSEVDELHQRIEHELSSVMDRLRKRGGAMVLEEFSDRVGDNSPFADLMEGVQVNTEREVGVATRSRLVERANRLAEALERHRNGEYGICEEGGQAISAARLRAMPEVTTCVCCQNDLEGTAQRSSRPPFLFSK